MYLLILEASHSLLHGGFVFFSKTLDFENLLISGWAGSPLRRRLSLAVVSGGCSLAVMQAAHCGGVSCGGAQPLGHTGFRGGGAWPQQLLLAGCREQVQ